MRRILIGGVGAIVLALSMAACADFDNNPPKSASGVSMTRTTVPTGTDGLTVEQRNVRDRLITDNKPGAVKHLYVISAYSGEVILYSTVKGKVTSSGKRLTPTTVGGGSHYDDHVDVNIAGTNHYTHEVLQDDGTFGQSNEYIYWWDVQGRYHQLYNSGGFLVTLSDNPLPVKSITINLEATR